MKIHGLSKVELVEHAKGLDLDVKGKKDRPSRRYTCS